MKKIPSSEDHAEHVYWSRRRFLGALAGAAAGAAALAACASPAAGPGAAPGALVTPDGLPLKVSASADELGDALTPYEAVTGYNNYYEFSTDKEDVRELARGFQTSPWQVAVGGLVRNPKTYDIDELRRAFDSSEERIYRLRCVEAWSMVIPWNGFPLKKLLAAAEPTAEAKYVRFETLLDPARMPGQNSGWYTWPYVEGLRLDEAMHDLTFMATGVYGVPLPPQNGAPMRLVVPWKYGFKSIKAIVKIDLVAEMPTSLWMAAAPSEYGFYANVNPEVDHPRWSQASERRIGETRRRPTLMFNGYDKQVADLYAGLDLAQNY